jgi:hypothetical protein
MENKKSGIWNLPLLSGEIMAGDRPNLASAVLTHCAVMTSVLKNNFWHTCTRRGDCKGS